MDTVIRVCLFLAVVIFSILGVLWVIGVKISVQDVAVRAGLILGILFVASALTAMIAKPSRRTED